MNYVYILQCADGTYYTGWTNDLEHRVQTHNAGKGAKYTRARRPVQLVYFERLDSAVEAQQREYRIKQLTRAQKLQLMAGEKDGEKSGGRRRTGRNLPPPPPSKPRLLPRRFSPEKIPSSAGKRASPS